MSVNDRAQTDAVHTEETRIVLTAMLYNAVDGDEVVNLSCLAVVLKVESLFVEWRSIP